jgi:hypothetical protein
VVAWSSFVTDTYFAPDMSKFAAAEIRDMTRVDREQEHWLTNFMLNSVLRGRLRSPVRQQIFNFLRRSHSAFTDYELARGATMRFLDDRQRIRTYLSAVGHWEDFLAHTWQANLLLSKAFIPHIKRPLFQAEDGSVNQRLHSLHTRAKHSEEAIERGTFPGESPLVVWLTNEGLKSTDAWLTFSEAADELEALAQWSDAVQDPLTMAEKIAALTHRSETEP